MALFLFLQISRPHILPAQEDSLPFKGEITSDNINVRCDSTVSSEAICKVNKGDLLEVVSEKYDWYKIKLPKNAPSFIKKELVSLIDEQNDIKTVKVLKDNVNIRLRADETSAILGRVDKDEVINVAQEAGDWYKIEPVDNSFGWIYKKFIVKASAAPATEAVKKEASEKGEAAEKEAQEVKCEGIIKPYGKVFKRRATHKLITESGQIYLLKGNKETLNALSYHKVRVNGKLTAGNKEKYPVIEIIKSEILD